MVGTLKEILEAQKGLTVFQYVEIMWNFLNDLQTQTRKGPLPHRKTAPTGLFCMSGPVAHADDDDDDAISSVHLQKEASRSHPPPEDKSCLATTRKELNAICCEKPLANIGNGAGSLESGLTIKCNWADGCLYEGEWGFDEHSGRGKICWSSGSFYEGEIMGGSLHGVGTFKGADGTIYKGNWILNKKHGFGRKRYANGDVYEGSWKWDVPEGQGRYFWNNGSEYYGGWKGGVMSGRGVLAWASGDKYDGRWLKGLADGHGVYTWADGSTYFGNWRNGLKHGEGRFYPPGNKCVETERLHYALLTCSEDDAFGDEVDARQNSCRQKVCSPSHLPHELRRLGQGSPLDRFTLGIPASSLEVDEEPDLFLERLWRLERSAGCLPRLHDAPYPSGCVLESSEENLSQGQDLPLSESDYGQHRWLMRERKRPGETIYKGHRSYDLMLNLQLGITYSVGKVMPQQKRRLLPADFGPKTSIRMNFPGDFKWKDYCPIVFRHLRETFKIDAADYMLSICGNDGLRELSSPGKSGSVFYLSQDQQFMIKTLRKDEVKVLLKMLPRYYDHVQMYKNTLLTKFFGLHRIKRAGGQKVRFIVMGNVVSTDSWIHRRFDLKGSSHGRSTEKDETDENTTLKDLDLDFVFQLESSSRDAVLEQISRDCKFLESEHIMDYSLLLGLHFKDPPSSETYSQSHSSMFDLPLHEVVISRFVESSAGFLEVEVGSKCPASRHPGLQQDNDTLGRQASLKSSTEEDAFFPQNESIQIGSNMPARACRRLPDGKDDSDSNEVYDVVLYFGVIDILQEYDMGKRFEHFYKSMQFDSLSISAVDPALYSKRFQHFMHEIFPANL